MELIADPDDEENPPWKRRKRTQKPREVAKKAFYVKNERKEYANPMRKPPHLHQKQFRRRRR